MRFLFLALAISGLFACSGEQADDLEFTSATNEEFTEFLAVELRRAKSQLTQSATANARVLEYNRFMDSPYTYGRDATVFPGPDEFFGDIQEQVGVLLSTRTALTHSIERTGRTFAIRAIDGTLAAGAYDSVRIEIDAPPQRSGRFDVYITGYGLSKDIHLEYQTQFQR